MKKSCSGWDCADTQGQAGTRGTHEYYWEASKVNSQGGCGCEAYLAPCRRVLPRYRRQSLLSVPTALPRPGHGALPRRGNAVVARVPHTLTHGPYLRTQPHVPLPHRHHHPTVAVPCGPHPHTRTCMLYFRRSAPRAPQCSSALQGGGSERVSSAAPATSPSSHSPQNRQLEPPERPAQLAEPWMGGAQGCMRSNFMCQYGFGAVWGLLPKIQA